MDNKIYLFSNDFDRKNIDTTKAVGVYEELSLNISNREIPYIAKLKKGYILDEAPLEYIAFQDNKGTWYIGSEVEFKSYDQVGLRIDATNITFNKLEQIKAP